MEEEKKIYSDVYEGLDPKVKARTKKMLMYFIIFAIVMIFAGLTSAYMVTNSGKYWVHIFTPTPFWLSNAAIVLSSLTFILALRKIKQGAQQFGLILLAATFVLGLLFTTFQYRGWQELQQKGMGFTIEMKEGVKVSQWNRIREIKAEYGKDYYVSVGDKILDFDGKDFYAPQDVYKTNPLTEAVGKTSNLASSYILVLVLLHVAHLFLGLIYLLVLTFRTFRGTINKDNTISLTTGGMYWHFLGILWIYLFLFLFIIH